MTPQYLDVSEVPDLLQAQQVLEAASAAFMSLPAAVRREFDNDPVKFVEFAQQPDNIDKLREWGLAAPKMPVDAPEPDKGASPAPEAEKPA